MTTPLGDDLAFGYNDSGIRTRKSVNNTFIDYTLDGSKILKESATGNQSYTIYYYYDANGSITGFNYNGTTYYYGKNVQGDIKYIYNTSGTIVTEYCYDAWGNILSITGAMASTVGEINPFRYRGYYYDTETGLYYLNSRYYDPQVGRFISPDTNSVISATPTSLNDKNLFAYCDNNPIIRKDSGGKFWETAFDIVSLAFSVVDVIKNPSDPWAWAGLVGDTLDLIPFVTGAGEVTKAISATNKIIDTVDDVHDTAKVVDNIGDTGKAIGKNVDELSDVVNGKRVFKDNSTFDPDFIDNAGRTNVERMNQGLSPIGTDGKSVNLHHVDQTDTGAVMEMTATTHQKNYKSLHNNTGLSPSKINRGEFNKWRNNYWQQRSNDFVS